MLDIKETDTGIRFKIFVQPKASKNAIVGLHDDALKIRLTAPPVDGAANKLCVKYLSKITGFSKSDIEIVAGQSSRAKQILIKCPSDKTARNAAIKTIKNLTIKKTP